MMPLGRRLWEQAFDGTNALTRQRVWRYDGSHIARIETYDGTGALVSGTWVSHGDRTDEVVALTLRAVTDDTGAVINEYSYDSYGDAQTTVEGLPQPFRYTGREWDSATALYHYRARAYDPVTGRFLQEDPLWFAAGDANLYRYVWNNPVNWNDPSGMTAATSYGRNARNAATLGGALATIGDALNCTFNILSSIFEGAGAGRHLANVANCAADFISPVPRLPKTPKFPKSPRPKKPGAGPSGPNGPSGAGGRGGNGGSGSGGNGGSGGRGGGSCSFSYDTQVLTASGFRKIGSVVAGRTLVWSRNAENGQMGWKPVTAHYSNPYKDTVYITIRDEKTGGKQSLVSNKIHPFFVQVPQNPNLLYLAKTAAGNALPVSSEGHHYQGPIANGHWVDAAQLKPGYRLLNSDESWSEVISVRVEKKPLKAYNITVADTHTFFVRGGANDKVPAVWVHNCGLPGRDSTGKVHGRERLPHPKDFSRYSRDDLIQLRNDLEKSVQARIRATVKHGRDKAHGGQQGIEHDLIQSLNHYLNR